MRINRLTLAILAATALTSCEQGETSRGSTLIQKEEISTGLNITAVSCVDLNRNWVCDDGDQSQWAELSTDTGTSQNGFYTLLEHRDWNNQRQKLLLSASTSLTASTTLDTILSLKGEPLANSTIENADELSDSYSKAIAGGYLPLPALSSVSTAAQNQTTSSPNIQSAINQIGEPEILAQWYSTDPSETRRQLSSQGDLILNNTDNNRLYLFDGSKQEITHHEIDLIPLDATTLAKTNAWQRKVLAWAKQGLDVMVDTVSAATAINGEVSSGSPVVLTPGQGITSAHVINGKSEALILVNMLDGRYTSTGCEQGSAVSEGIFRIPLNNNASSQQLERLSTCIHSGFSLLSTSINGEKYAAWDPSESQVWFFENDELSTQAAITTEHPIQAITLTPGGNYLAAVAFGKAIILDTSTGIILHTLSGSWGNVISAKFTNGGRSLLVASSNEVHTLHLNAALQLVSHNKQSFSSNDEDIRSLNVMSDGDSYFAVSNKNIQWLKSDGTHLASHTLPHGLDVQQSVTTHNKLLVLARGSQDMKFELLRYPLSLPSLSAVSE